MVAALRALISVLMLAGFYVLAFVQFVVVLVFGVWLATVLHRSIAINVMIPLLTASFGAVAYGMWKAIRDKPKLPAGLPLSRAQVPALWATVDELAQVVGTRTPDDIVLIPDVNAAVMEQTKLMGLIGGRRHLFIGLPLIQAFTVAQLRSVIAHELGHYSGKHTRLAGVSYRGRLAIRRTVDRIGPANPVGWVFKGYARLFVMVQNTVSRQQEREADQAAVWVAGRHAAATALRELDVLDSAYGYFFERYVGWGWESGYAPDDLFAGFAELVRARTEELNRLRAQVPTDKPSVWDTHPPLSERLAAIGAALESHVPSDDRPAWVMVPDLPAAGRALQNEVMDLDGRTVLGWPEFTAAAATASQQRGADPLLRALSRAAGQPVPDLATVLDLIAAGRLDQLAEPLFRSATRKEARQRFAEPVADLIKLAAVRSGIAAWQHSWSEPVKLVGRDGAEFDPTEIAELAVDPATLDDARGRLTALGIDVHAAQAVEVSASPAHADVLGGIANVKLDDERLDLVVLSSGLLLVASPSRKGGRGAVNRVVALLNTGPAKLAALPGHRFLPFEEMTGVVKTSSVPETYQLTLHSGQSLTLKVAVMSTEEAPGGYETLTEVMKRLSKSRAAAV